MRALHPGLDTEVVALIDERLHRVAAGQRVAIPWAIESGSRAWGFPSPDSDYDCRFFFVRPHEAYLSPWPQRDVIETPLDRVLDVNGWDLIKAVRLAVAGNATVGEWLRSPIVYCGEPDFREQLLALCDRVADLDAIRRHYLHVGRSQWTRATADAGCQVKLKRVFYALRPAAALHWMRLHAMPTPPMNLTQLLDEAPVPPALRAAVEDLVAAKAVTRELGQGLVPAPVREFVIREFTAADVPPATDPGRLAAARRDAATTFRDLIERWAPTP